mmetsp:Transcript_2872/g.6759  ORF Transcript_2872/g.6759 Transcript_2872/m.6759 type:complete len:200 (-) Transcript_2872:23-622(-)
MQFRPLQLRRVCDAREQSQRVVVPLLHLWLQPLLDERVNRLVRLGGEVLEPSAHVLPRGVHLRLQPVLCAAKLLEHLLRALGLFLRQFVESHLHRVRLGLRQRGRAQLFKCAERMQAPLLVLLLHGGQLAKELLLLLRDDHLRRVQVRLEVRDRLVVAQPPPACEALAPPLAVRLMPLHLLDLDSRDQLGVRLAVGEDE